MGERCGAAETPRSPVVTSLEAAHAAAGGPPSLWLHGIDTMETIP